MKTILIIPKIEIQNANALSSPYSIGFPAMTAWLGAMHALQRRLQQQAKLQKVDGPFMSQLKNISFKGLAVISHRFNLRTYREDGDFVSSIIGSSHPLVPKKEKGKPEGNAVRPSFVEEAKCHMQVSLLIEIDTQNWNLSDWQPLTQQVDHQMMANMKIAGGDILSCQPAWIQTIATQIEHNCLIRKLMPGHCLIERRDLMSQEMRNGKDAIDALLEFLYIKHHCKWEENDIGSLEKNETEEEEHKPFYWKSNKKELGWIVPIATGFQGISELGKAEHQRDSETPHCFAESMITLGQFIMPYRLENLDQMLWHYHYDSKQNLYLCQPNQTFSQVF